MCALPVPDEPAWPLFLPMLVADIPYTEHSLERLLIPNILQGRCGEALLPPSSLPLSRHHPALIPFRVLVVKNEEAGRLLLSAHALEAGLRNRSPYHLFAGV